MNRAVVPSQSHSTQWIDYNTKYQTKNRKTLKVHTYFSDCVDKRVVSFVEGQSPGTIDDPAVDVSSKVNLKFKFTIMTQFGVKISDV